MEAIPNVNGVTKYRFQVRSDQNGGRNLSSIPSQWMNVPEIQVRIMFDL